MKIRSLTYI